MYNEDGIYVEEKPKKKSGCLGLFIVLVVLIPVLFFGGIAALLVWIFASMAEAEPEKQLTMNEFEDVAIENGFECSMSDDIKYIMKNVMKAENGDCVIYFLNGGDGLYTQDLIEVDFKDSQSDKAQENQYEFTSETFQSFTKDTADTFYYTCGTEHTAVYVMVPISEKDEALELLSAMDYWNEQPEFFDKVEEWLESAERRIDAPGGR